MYKYAYEKEVGEMHKQKIKRKIRKLFSARITKKRLSISQKCNKKTVSVFTYNRLKEHEDKLTEIQE